MYIIHIDAMNNKRGKTYFKKYTSHFIVRGSWRPNKDCNILTSPAPPDIAVCRSRSPDAQLEVRGLSFLMAFSTTSCLSLI